MTHELKTGGDRGYLRIATEEAFATHEQLDAIMRMVAEGTADKGTKSLWGFYGTSPSERTTFIRDRLLTHLKGQPWAHTALLNVTVNNGVIDLWGVTNSEAERKAIRVAAEEIAGPYAVKDNLILQPPLAGV